MDIINNIKYLEVMSDQCLNINCHKDYEYNYVEFKGFSRLGKIVTKN